MGNKKFVPWISNEKNCNLTVLFFNLNSAKIKSKANKIIKLTNDAD